MIIAGGHDNIAGGWRFVVIDRLLYSDSRSFLHRYTDFNNTKKGLRSLDADIIRSNVSLGYIPIKVMQWSAR